MDPRIFIPGRMAALMKTKESMGKQMIKKRQRNTLDERLRSCHILRIFRRYGVLCMSSGCFTVCGLKRRQYQFNGNYDFRVCLGAVWGASGRTVVRHPGYPKVLMFFSFALRRRFLIAGGVFIPHKRCHHCVCCQVYFVFLLQRCHTLRLWRICHPRNRLGEVWAIL